MSGLEDLRLVVGAPFVGALLVSLAPARAGRGIAAIGALVTCGLLAASIGAPVIEVPWVVRGLALRLAVDPLALVGAAACAVAGVMAVLEETRPSRGRLAGLLALQGTALAGLLAGDVFVLAGAWTLAPALVIGLTSGTGSPRARIAGRALALGLALAAGAVLFAAAALVVAHHGATGGAWSAGLIELAGVRVPTTQALPIAGALGLAGALALGLWPLHAGLTEGTAATSPGLGRMLAGPLRWLGLDALIRLWAPLVPVGAAALAPGLAGLAIAGALMLGLVARGEPEPRRSALLGAVPWALAAAGVATLALEGIVGALVLGLAGTFSSSGRAGRLVSGLVIGVGGGLVAIAALRFSDMTLGTAGPWCAFGAALALVLALSAGQGFGDRVLGTGEAGGETAGARVGGQVSGDRWARWVALAGAALLAGLMARPGALLERVSASGEAWVEAIARQRCLALRVPRVVAVVMPEGDETCAAALAELRGALTEARRGATQGGAGDDG